MLAGSLSSLRLAAAPEQLTWGITAFPLLLLKKDQQPKSSLNFDPLEPIIQGLPDYTHQLQTMNISRALLELKKRDDVCIIGLQRSPERDQLGYFTALYISLPPQLVIRSSDAAGFSNPPEGVALGQLLQRTDLRGAVLAGRYYGADLTPVIQSAVAQGRLQSIQTSGSGSNVLDMLRHGRIDYTLEYAEAIQLIQTIPEMHPIIQTLTLLPLKETTAPIVSGIYCSRTDKGKALIRKIDQIASEPQVREHYRAASQALTPAAARQHYSDWFDAFYNRREPGAFTNLDD